MKKLLIGALSIALVATSVTSCAKSSRGKMSNDWTVSSFKEVSTDASGSNSQTRTVSGTETTISINDDGDVTNGSISKNTYTIKKDGTWEAAMDYSFSGTTNGVTVATTTTTMRSGTWNFIGKNKTEDFKKNERIMFNTLSDKNTTTTKTTFGTTTQTSTSSDTDTYMAGENVVVYTVVESKKKELTLATDGKSTYSSSNGSSTTNGSTTSTSEITLVQK